MLSPSPFATPVPYAQPSLSQQIRKLEDELGVKLFDRLGRSVRLTEFGRSFLPRARTVLHDLETARSEVAERKSSLGGSICIGAIPTIAPYFLPEILTKFSRKWPQARLSVVEEITPQLLEKLRGGDIDIAIVALPLQVHGHEFESHPLMTEKLFRGVTKESFTFSSHIDFTAGTGLGTVSPVAGRPLFPYDHGRCLQSSAHESTSGL
jgi:LysR family transcriptional regulator, hydrogen peroxide-inducible genes activator